MLATCDDVNAHRVGRSTGGNVADRVPGDVNGDFKLLSSDASALQTFIGQRQNFENTGIGVDPLDTYVAPSGQNGPAQLQPGGAALQPGAAPQHGGALAALQPTAAPGGAALELPPGYALE